MSDREQDRTYQPEYAELPLRVTEWFKGPSPSKCSECGAIGEHEAQIAIKEGDEYHLFTVWGCRECGYHWRTRARPLLNLFRYKTKRDPKFFGHEVVKRE